MLANGCHDIDFSRIRGQSNIDGFDLCCFLYISGWPARSCVSTARCRNIWIGIPSQWCDEPRSSNLQRRISDPWLVIKMTVGMYN